MRNLDRDVDEVRLVSLAHCYSLLIWLIST